MLLHQYEGGGPPSEQWKVYLLLALLVCKLATDWCYCNIDMPISDYLHAISVSLLLSQSSLLDLWLLLIINVIMCIIGAIIDPQQLVTMDVSILYLVLFAPASLFCWFLPTYYAYK